MTVYFFTREDHSEYFKQLLSEKAIRYEFQFDEEEGKYYFGIQKSDEKISKKLNFLVFAKYRKPFIESGFAKVLLLGITLLFIILSLIGFYLA